MGEPAVTPEEMPIDAMAQSRAVIATLEALYSMGRHGVPLSVLRSLLEHLQGNVGKLVRIRVEAPDDDIGDWDTPSWIAPFLRGCGQLIDYKHSPRTITFDWQF